MSATLLELAEAERWLESQTKKALDVGPAMARLRSYLFKQQQAMMDDAHRFIAACAGRRAGKSVTVACMLLGAALLHPGRVALYLSLSRIQGKGILWGTLKLLNDKFNLGGQPNESELAIYFPNGAQVVIMGVNDRPSIENKRGLGFSIVVQDESQSVPEYLKTLVDEVLTPGLADVRGKLVMIGTPSLLPRGYWYDCYHGDPEVWGRFTWTMLDNPFILDPQQTIADELQRRGVTIDDASIQREWFGRWVRDILSAVFSFDPGVNSYAVLPPGLDPRLWRYVIAVDIGGGVERDNDAVSVLGFHAHHRATYLLEEHIDAKQDVTTLALKVLSIRHRLDPRKVVSVVADTGGIGAKVAKEMESRHKLPIVAAKKQDKWANIELLNAACRHGEFFALPTSAFTNEAVKVEKDWEKSTPDKIAIKGHMPDIVDSVLYGFVESLAWLAKDAPPVPPPPGSREAAAQMAEREMKELVAERQREKRQKDRDYGTGEEWGRW